MAVPTYPTSAFPRQSFANNGTAQLRAPSVPGTSQFYFQGGHFGCDAGGPLSVVFTDGTAAAAGTVATLVIGSAGQPGVGFQIGAGGDRWEGVVISGAGGLGMKAVGGNAGTIQGYVYGREVPRAI